MKAVPSTMFPIVQRQLQMVLREGGVMTTAAVVPAVLCSTSRCGPCCLVHYIYIDL